MQSPYKRGNNLKNHLRGLPTKKKEKKEELFLHIFIFKIFFFHFLIVVGVVFETNREAFTSQFFLQVIERKLSVGLGGECEKKGEKKNKKNKIK